MAALPALWVFLLSVVEAARRYAQARRQALERPPTPVERLRGLPETSEERLAALDAVLRQALYERVGTPVSELDRVQAVTLLPEPLARQTLECSRALDRARFAAGETVDEDAVIAVIQALVSR